MNQFEYLSTGFQKVLLTFVLQSSLSELNISYDMSAMFEGNISVL